MVQDPGVTKFRRRRGRRVEVGAVFGVMAAYDGDLITQQLRDYGAHTRPELAFFSSVVWVGDCVFDLGAHIGTWAIPLAQRVGAGGTVVAVEAHRDNFSLLVDNIAANGLGEVARPVNATLAPAGSQHKLVFDQRNSGATRLVRRRVWERSREDQVCGIDDISLAFGAPDVIKVDIEGLELSALEASDVVRTVRPVIYAEVSAEHLLRYSRTVESFDVFLRGLDYRLFRNVGERNASHDRFEVAELTNLSEGGAFFDVLAIPTGVVGWQASCVIDELVDTSGDRGIYACVLEIKPRFEVELLRWFAALTEVAEVAATDLVVSVAGSGRSRLLGYLRARGVNVLGIEPFDQRSPHCNKIAGAQALATALGRADVPVVLTDTDVVVLEDARLIEVDRHAFALKPVDAPYPPLEILTAIFDEASVLHPPLVRLHHVPSENSFVTNGNGGMYVLRSTLLAEIAAEWGRWAQWILERRGALGDWHVHVDQVAMALTLAAIDCKVQPLDVVWNYPIHVPTWISTDAPVPAVIHYHDHVRRNGMLRYVGVPAIDDRIQRANVATKEIARHSLGRSIWAELLLRQVIDAER